MKNLKIRMFLKLGMLSMLLSLPMLITNCSKDDESPPPDYIWDIDTQGIPKFVTENYIELEKVYRISKFRSSVGHDYSDAYESCRSMKHYFEPFADADWTSVKIYSPISGKLTRVEQEWTGTKLEIESTQYKAFRFQIFHINLNQAYQVGDMVTAGQLLGTHIGTDTYSDISVIVNDPTKQGRFVSYFYVITDNVFQQYVTRGAASREDFIISKTLRDANPLDCNNFGIDDPLEKWFVLD
jgi:hypothetical protein